LEKFRASPLHRSQITISSLGFGQILNSYPYTERVIASSFLYIGFEFGKIPSSPLQRGLGTWKKSEVSTLYRLWAISTFPLYNIQALGLGKVLALGLRTIPSFPPYIVVGT